jgi:hypothetical protein
MVVHEEMAGTELLSPHHELLDRAGVGSDLVMWDDDAEFHTE